MSSTATVLERLLFAIWLIWKNCSLCSTSLTIFSQQRYVHYYNYTWTDFKTTLLLHCYFRNTYICTITGFWNHSKLLYLQHTTQITWKELFTCTTTVWFLNLFYYSFTNFALLLLDFSLAPRILDFRTTFQLHFKYYTFITTLFLHSY